MSRQKLLQRVPACPLTVKGSIKITVEGVSEHHAKTGKMASFFAETFVHGQLLTERLTLGTFCAAFHASTEGAVDRGHLSPPCQVLLPHLLTLKSLWERRTHGRPFRVTATRLGTSYHTTAHSLRRRAEELAGRDEDLLSGTILGEELPKGRPKMCF